MIDKSAAQNYTFKARVFLFVWVLLTGASWYFLDNLIDEAIAKEFHIFLQATLASLSPVQLLGEKPFINIAGKSYRAAEVAAYLYEQVEIKKMVQWFFIYVPIVTSALTGFIFYLRAKKIKASVQVKQQLNKWSGKDE